MRGVSSKRFEEYVVCMPTRDGHFDMTIGCGAPMGDPLAVQSFGKAFAPAIINNYVEEASKTG